MIKNDDSGPPLSLKHRGGSEVTADAKWISSWCSLTAKFMLRLQANEAGTGVTAIRCGYVVLSLHGEWRVEIPGTEYFRLARSQPGQCPPNYPDEAQHPSPAGDQVPNGRECPIVQTPM